MSVHENTKKGSHFSYEERLCLEYYLKGTGHFPKIKNTKQLGEIFYKTIRTIQREIKRGTIEHETSSVHTNFEYNADFAQQDAEYEMTAKGTPLKLSKDWHLVGIIQDLIINEHYSPYAVVHHFNNKGWPTNIKLSEKTLYNYISKKVIPGLGIKDLPNKGIKFKKHASVKRHSRAACALRSISNRPEYINTRREYGHWEIDTVKSCADTTVECLLTLTERKSRAEIIRKISDGKASSVVKEIHKLEKELGYNKFTKLFKSITADCGSEFMDFIGIETSVSGKKRTAVFFAHPYCARERGTNENHNRIIRRFYPKGTDFSNLNSELFKDTQKWMNNYPRKILGGRTPLQDLQTYMGSEFLIPS
jgi:transposase, IS30 family